MIIKKKNPLDDNNAPWCKWKNVYNSNHGNNLIHAKITKILGFNNLYNRNLPFCIAYSQILSQR